MSMQYCKLCSAKTSNLCVRVPKNENKRKLWIKAADTELSEGSKICEKHFTDSDFYYPNAKRRILLPNAVPRSVFTKRLPSACGENKFDFASQTQKEVIDCGIALENLRLQLKVNELQRQNTVLNQKLKSMETLTDSLKAIFTDSQIKKLQSGSKQVNWNKEDIAYGICLQAAGPRAYRHLLKKGFPLPCVSSLLKWSQSLKVEPGPLSFVIDLMEKAVDVEQEDKVCVLQFGKMKIGSVHENDSSKETVLQQSADFVQVGMVQGLRKGWKQPIYFDYDEPMTTTILNMLIEKLYSVGYHVVAMVSDMGPGKYKLWSQLQVTAEKPWFEHPANAEMKVFVFADVSHLIKLIRNHFIDSGLIIGNTIINVQTIKQAMNHASASNLSIQWKVTEEHLSGRSTGRKKVKLASQLFSNTTANAIRRCISLGLEVSNACETSEFVQMINDWFDIFNVKLSAGNTLPTQQPFGQKLDAQRKVLSDMTALMSLPIVPNSKKSLPFQKGVIVSNASLDMLYGYVAAKYDMKYLITSRISQDQLQNFFDAMRSESGEGGFDDSPSAIQFKFRLRKYLLCNGLVFDDQI